MANMLFEMVLRNNKYDNGVSFTNMFDESRIGYSFATFLLLLLVGLVVQACIIYKYVIKSGYVSSSDEKASSEALQREAGSISRQVAVSIKDLQMTFDNGSVRAVDGLDVDFYKNEITSFLGHNGAGKTSTIQILTGLIRPTGGDAFILGNSIVHNMDAVRESISVCPQDNILWDTLTVEEHCKLWFGIRRCPVNDALISQCLSEVGLLEKIDSAASTLSGGQKRKVRRHGRDFS
jgi:ABC-type transport system involved in cytochrome c biogenesis ATPase subunit